MESTNVVARGEPLKLSTVAVTKFVPVTLRSKPAPPAVAEVGVKEATVGTRLLTGALPPEHPASIAAANE